MFKNNLKIKYFFIIFFLFISYISFSHPHIFIDYKANFIFENNSLLQININWFFDKYFSVSVIKNFDSNNNGIIDKNELEKFTKTTYESLSNYNYFIQLFLNNKDLKIKKITNFKVKIESKDLIIYSFSIPCNIKGAEQNQTIKLYFEDPTYFVALSTSQKSISSKNDGSIDIIKSFIKDKYEQTIEFKKK
jgi:ABC-type uncharacterized transport system substrate-binding protein